MLEGRDLLDSDLPAARSVQRRADDAIRALADDVEHLVLSAWGCLSRRAGVQVGRAPHRR
jgi:hypothetical protein